MDVDDDYVKIKAEYCPEAVLNWYTHCHGHKRTSAASSLKAKKHLLAVGWLIWQTTKTGDRRELRYKSPAGKVYYSLIAACKTCISQAGRGFGPMAVSCSNASKPPSNTVQGTGYSCVENLRKRKYERDSAEGFKKGFLDSQASRFSYSRTGKPVNMLKELYESREKEKKLEVQGSSKRVRQDVVSSSSNGNSNIGLSWLIDNGVVPLGAKVNYLGKMAEGKVTREGIQCSCCGKVFTLTGFEFHAGSTKHRPAAHIFLEDGRSLRDCKDQAKFIFSQKSSFSKRKSISSIIDDKVQSNNVNQNQNEMFCSVCLFGGELLLCDGCPSAFHMACIGCEKFPEGDWFCTSCCCGVCKENITRQDCGLRCDQCQQKCHNSCLQDNLNNWFCSTQCQRVFSSLHDVIAKPVHVGEKNLRWTLLKPLESENPGRDPVGFEENQSKLQLALNVMHECFEPTKDVYTGRDIVEDVIFGRGSELSRLNFKGFYTVVLEEKEKVVSVATVRIHRDVAEIPLVATRFRNQRQGMCRILMNELEKQLLAIGIESLVLPAARNVVDTWINSFGFSRMTDGERVKLLNRRFLDFHDTVMCHKLLKNSKLPNPTDKSSLTEEPGKQEVDNAAGELGDIDDEFDWVSYLNGLQFLHS